LYNINLYPVTNVGSTTQQHRTKRQMNTNTNKYKKTEGNYCKRSITQETLITYLITYALTSDYSRMARVTSCFLLLSSRRGSSSSSSGGGGGRAARYKM